MLITMKDWRENIFFILVEPKITGNIGAAARAMKNMGFKKLELVKPVNFLDDEARSTACHAVDVLEEAIVYPDLKKAIKDKSMIIGTTRRFGRRRGFILPLEDSIERIITAARKNKIAILFGREDKGLSNKETEECGFLITIPTDSSFPSLNLAQSVLIVAYELNRKTLKKETPVLAKYEELEALYKHIFSSLKLLDYIPRGDRDLETKIMNNLKHLIGRAGLTDWELRMLHGICSQIEKKIKVKGRLKTDWKTN